jgi:hypothetical protein
VNRPLKIQQSGRFQEALTPSASRSLNLTSLPASGQAGPTTNLRSATHVHGSGLVFPMLLAMTSIARAQHPLRHHTDAVETRYARSQPVVGYTLRVDTADLAAFAMEMRIRNVPDTFRLAMVAHPEHWIKYYQGSDAEKALKRKYSLSDRIRYYWAYPQVQQAFEKLMENLNQNSTPVTLLKQYAPDEYTMTGKAGGLNPEKTLLAKIQNVLDFSKQGFFRV